MIVTRHASESQFGYLAIVNNFLVAISFIWSRSSEGFMILISAYGSTRLGYMSAIQFHVLPTVCDLNFEDKIS